MMDIRNINYFIKDCSGSVSAILSRIKHLKEGSKGVPDSKKAVLVLSGNVITEQKLNNPFFLFYIIRSKMKLHSCQERKNTDDKKADSKAEVVQSPWKTSKYQFNKFFTALSGRQFLDRNAVLLFV